MTEGALQVGAGNKDVLLVGAGPHAQKVYLPWFKRKGQLFKTRIRAVVELESKSSETEALLQSLHMDVPVLQCPELSTDSLPVDFKQTLNQVIRKFDIKGIIIASEPSSHKAYALWALENGLNILMDKPLTARANTLTDISAASQLVSDYSDINAAYKKALEVHPDIIFTVCSQRRYHPSFDRVKERIRDVLDKTNTPITSIQSSHSDGQWRLPNELVEIDYHGFTNGYGKVSHSGYHFFDLINQLVSVGTIPEKAPDTAEVYAMLTTPADYLFQTNISDYSKFFKDYKTEYTQEDLTRRVNGYGEINAFSLINLKHGQRNVCTIQLSLQHNSFSRRSWITPNSDLYKGNGRVKHEYHAIQQGPFQSIQIHSYQIQASADDDSRINDYGVGGRNHLDIYIFRNSEIVGGQPLEIVSVNDLMSNPDNSEIHTAIVKASVVEEFIEYLHGRLKREEVRSELPSHSNAVSLMAATYKSNAQRLANQSPIATFEWQQ